MIKNKDGSITFKNKTELKNYVKNKEADAIQQYTKKVRDVAVLDVAKDVSEKVSLLSFEALNLEHGLRKKRLKEFSDRYNSLFECFESGLSSKGLLVHFGTVDSDYRGEVLVIATNLTNEPFALRADEKIAQLVFVKKDIVELAQVEEISNDTSRGTGGFGSTGRF